MWFRHEYPQPLGQPTTFYWAAEATGPNAVPPEMSAYEAPKTLAEEVGIANPTGPNLVVYATPARGSYVITPTSASVTGPSGEQLPVHLLPGWFDNAIVLLDSPVQPDSQFAVTVHWLTEPSLTDPAEMTQTFGFTTGALPPEEEVEESSRFPLALRLRVRGSRIHIISSLALRGHQVRVSIRRIWVPCALVIADKRCTWVRKGRAAWISRRIAKGLSLRFRPPGDWEKVVISAATKAFEREGKLYAAAPASVTLSGPKPKGVAR